MLERSIRRLHRFLSSEFPFTWRIVVADNASTDTTPAIGARLARELPGVALTAAGPQGPRTRAARGVVGEPRRASSVTWTPTSRPTCARCCRSSPRCCPATRTSRSGRGSPTAPASCAAPSASSSRAPTTACCTPRCARASPTRSAGSRRSGATSSTTCCPRSATTAGSSTPSCWCSRSARGLRIHEVPVDWVDDPDSRVDVVRTAIDDLKGVARLASARRASRASCPSASPARSRTRCCSSRCAAPLGAGAANALALALTAVGNTAANRRFTFRLRGRAGLARQHVLGAFVYVLTLGLTDRRARRPARPRREPDTRRRARRPRHREHRRHRHALSSRCPQLGVRPRPRLSGNSKLSVDNGW